MTDFFTARRALYLAIYNVGSAREFCTYPLSAAKHHIDI